MPFMRFPSRMLDCAVLKINHAQVRFRFVCEYSRSSFNIIGNEPLQCRLVGLGYRLRNNFPAPSLLCAYYGNLANRPAPCIQLLRRMLVSLLAADIGLVHFHYALHSVQQAIPKVVVFCKNL